MSDDYLTELHKKRDELDRELRRANIQIAIGVFLFVLAIGFLIWGPR